MKATLEDAFLSYFGEKQVKTMMMKYELKKFFHKKINKIILIAMFILAIMQLLP